MSKILKSIWLSVLIFSVAVGQSQISIGSSSMPNAGDTFWVSDFSSSELQNDFTKGGSNKQWDFSALTPLNQRKLEFFSANKTPYAFYFFNQIGQKTADSLGGGPIMFSNIYSFYSKSINSYKASGIGYSVSGFPLAAKNTDEDEIYIFPLNYNDTDVTTFTFEFSIPGQDIFKYKQAGKRTNIVDAWGSLKTPYATYPSTLRIKTIVEGVDTLEVQGFKTPLPRKEITYKWLTTTQRNPVMEVTLTEFGGQTVPQTAYYLDKRRATNSIFRPERAMFTLYPNPIADRLYANSNFYTFLPYQMPLKLRVFSLNGAQMNEIELNTNPIDGGYYDVSHLPKGMYLIELPDGLYKIIK
jgi:hypothetical protein